MYVQVDREKLRGKRMERMMTQRDLASAAGVSLNTVSRAESRDGHPLFLSSLQRIALALRCDAIELADLNGRKP
ncbi:MAG: helix-turn-helix domain-containing protein [Vicinamibacterales bacterium]